MHPARIRLHLQHTRYPRTMLFLMLLLAGGTGAIASKILLLCGIGAMWERFPLVVVATWSVLALLVRGWSSVESRMLPPACRKKDESDPRIDGTGVAAEVGGAMLDSWCIGAEFEAVFFIVLLLEV